MIHLLQDEVAQFTPDVVAFVQSQLAEKWAYIESVTLIDSQNALEITEIGSQFVR